MARRGMHMHPALRAELMRIKSNDIEGYQAVFAELSARIGYKTPRLASIVDNPKEVMLKTKHKVLWDLIFTPRPAVRMVVKPAEMAFQLSVDPLADDEERSFGYGCMGYLKRSPTQSTQALTQRQIDGLYLRYGALVERRKHRKVVCSPLTH